MTNHLDELWERLRQFNIVDGPRPGLLITLTPWYVKLVLAISGWVAALFLIAFTASIFNELFKSALASFAFGTALLLLAYCALRDSGEFVSHAGFALSLAGQVFVVFAAARVLNEQVAPIALFTGLLAVVLFFVMNGFLHRVYSALTACIALYLAVNFSHLDKLASDSHSVQHAILLALYAFLAAWSWLNEFRHPLRYPWTHALSWGVSLAVIGIGTFASFTGETLLGRHVLGTSSLSGWLSQALLGIVLIWTVACILKRQSVSNPKIRLACLGGAIAISFLSFTASGIVIGVLFILLAQQQQNRTLLGLGCIALGVYVVRYYYLLDQSLAYKSGVLLISGIVCLIIRQFVKRIATLSDLDTKAASR